MRGVGRQSTTVLQVSSDSHWREVGDEALEIVHTTGVPVVVARSRVAGAQYVVNQNLGNVIVLDDGFQHRWLHRDLDVVLIPGEHDRLSSDLFRHRLLPLGLLREPVAAAVRRTNVVLVTRRITLKDSVATDALERVLDRTIDGEVLLTPRLPLASHDAKTCVAYCGIGRPEHFFAFLESQGLVIRQKLTLADHAVPSEQELRELAASGQVILTTVKDWMKLSADWREKVLSVSLAASPDALPLLLSVLKKFLAKARRIDSEL
jgi:tetraacyldisaccharide 4'-kinase